MQPAPRPGAPTFSRPGEAYPGAPPAPPQPQAAPFGVPPPRPSKTSPLAIASLVCAAVPLLFLPLGQFLPDDFGVLGLLILPGPILAIIFGALALNQIKREPHVYGGRGLALAGLITGIVEIGFVVAMFLMALIAAAIMAAVCASATGSCAAPQLATVGTRSARPPLRLRWGGVVRALAAHHPDCAHFDADLLCVAGWRVCASCATMATSLGATTLMLAFAPTIPWELLLAAGIVVGSAELASRIGLTRTRGFKVAVKTLLGAGLAMAVHGLVAAPWTWTVKAALLLGVAGSMMLLASDRIRRLSACAPNHGAVEAWPSDEALPDGMRA